MRSIISPWLSRIVSGNQIPIAATPATYPFPRFPPLESSALDAGEQYYSAFQFVAWAGAGAREALEAAMFETAGEA